jgi:hypothetical protein
MKKTEMVKAAGSLIISIGVGSIVGNVIKTTTPGSIGALKKVCIGAGSVVLSNMVGDKAVDYVEEKIEGFTTWIKDLVKEEKETECVVTDK